MQGTTNISAAAGRHDEAKVQGGHRGNGLSQVPGAYAGRSVQVKYIRNWAAIRVGCQVWFTLPSNMYLEKFPSVFNCPVPDARGASDAAGGSPGAG